MRDSAAASDFAGAAGGNITNYCRQFVARQAGQRDSLLAESYGPTTLRSALEYAQFMRSLLNKYRPKHLSFTHADRCRVAEAAPSRSSATTPSGATCPMLNIRSARVNKEAPIHAEVPARQGGAQKAGARELAV